MRVLDIKTRIAKRQNRWENLPLLTPHDEIKFVLCDENDYCGQNKPFCNINSPSGASAVFARSWRAKCHAAGRMDMRDRLPVRMLLQLHKQLWDNTPGH